MVGDEDDEGGGAQSYEVEFFGLPPKSSEIARDRLSVVSALAWKAHLWVSFASLSY